MCLWPNWGVNIHDLFLCLPFYSFFGCKINLNNNPVNKCLTNPVTLLQSIKVNLKTVYQIVKYKTYDLYFIGDYTAINWVIETALS